MLKLWTNVTAMQCNAKQSKFGRIPTSAASRNGRPKCHTKNYIMRCAAVRPSSAPVVALTALTHSLTHSPTHPPTQPPITTQSSPTISSSPLLIPIAPCLPLAEHSSLCAPSTPADSLRPASKKKSLKVSPLCFNKCMSLCPLQTREEMPLN